MNYYKKKNICFIKENEKVWICGTITYIKDNCIILDDNTKTILIKFKQNVKFFNIGDILVIFGETIKEDDQIIVIPHITRKIDEKRELLWKFEAYKLNQI